MIKVKKYKHVLMKIQKYLKKFNDKIWLPKLDRWIEELNSFKDTEQGDQLRLLHLQRTKGSFTDRGLFAKVVISPEAGHDIPNNPGDILKANDKLISLLDKLDKVTIKVLKKNHALPEPPPEPEPKEAQPAG